MEEKIGWTDIKKLWMNVDGVVVDEAILYVVLKNKSSLDPHRDQIQGIIVSKFEYFHPPQVPLHKEGGTRQGFQATHPPTSTGRQPWVHLSNAVPFLAVPASSLTACTPPRADRR